MIVLTEELARYNFKIMYQLDNKVEKPDALSRHSEYYSKSLNIAKENKNKLIITIFKPEQFRNYDLEYIRLMIIFLAQL
jgi:hypothetical protein